MKWTVDCYAECVYNCIATRLAADQITCLAIVYGAKAKKKHSQKEEYKKLYTLSQYVRKIVVAYDKNATSLAASSGLYVFLLYKLCERACKYEKNGLSLSFLLNLSG